LKGEVVLDSNHEGKNEFFEVNTYYLPKGRKALINRWTFKLNKDCNQIAKYKARVVVIRYVKRKASTLAKSSLL